MARCEACGRNMLTAPGCTAQRLQFAPYTRRLSESEIDDLAEGRLQPATVTDAKKVETFDRIRYDNTDHDGAARCGDCGVKNGGFHHPGCDQERCPRCHGQLLACICNDEGVFSDVIERTVKDSVQRGPARASRTRSRKETV